MIIDIILPVSLIFIMFSLGLGLTIKDFKNIMSNPIVVFVGLINQMLILPLVTFLIIILFNLSSELAVGMIILSCCPGGVTSNIITKLAKGDTALSISYTAVVSVVSVFTLPLIVGYSISYFNLFDENIASFSILKLGMTMFVITTIPVLFGLYLNVKHKNISNSFYPIANKISTFLFIIIVLGALASEWNTFINNLEFLGPAIITLIFTMMIIGYNAPKLFGISKKQSITIAIESGIQNGTIGITIGNIILNQSHGISILSLPSGVYSILMYVVCLPIIFFFIRQK